MKTALVTGASSGIGAAFAKELAKSKTNLVLVARSQDKLEQLAKQLQQQHPIQVEVMVQDLSLPGAAREVYDKITQKGLMIDTLINNAGFGDYGKFTQRELSRQVEMIHLNITTLVELTYLVLAPMQSQGYGNIINVASIAAFQPLPYLSVYAATKAFVLSFTEAIWAENKNTGVNILALCPGPTESQFFQVAQFPASFNGQNQGEYTSASQVVQDALKALEKPHSTLVTGGLSNQIIVNLHRFLPREVLLSAVEQQFKAK
ncbi:short-chain dehydrogenase/reductase SDR [Gloeothece citriformis PCC 7424]|uniref:Short-chain dehydrogenase/reductase SDR n=1 Tax=Gloeothece citriformis (strain PCC 7424) TaxID=65393 RepID=B7KCG3_GLOC7|nr:SDR family oxidoreductase [Gloeothece citriformis]ACK70268.1 short-chain dehydrogenase/reductase SDR [Gloeothece citriformis PCC 7424]